MEPLTVRAELRPDPFHTFLVSHSRLFEDVIAVHSAAVVCRFAEQAHSRETTHKKLEKR